jgi:hypothetical protein
VQLVAEDHARHGGAGYVGRWLVVRAHPCSESR